MKFKKCLLSSLLFLITGNLFLAQIKQLTKEEVKQDFAFVRNTVLETPVAPFQFISKEQFLKESASIESELLKKKVVTTKDIYLAMQPLIVKLRDGHSELDGESLFNNSNYLVFPYEVNIYDKSLEIASAKYDDQQLKENEVKGKNIAYINGFSKETILSVINKYTSGETEHTRLSLGQDYFNLYYNLFFSNSEKLELKLESKEKLAIDLHKKENVTLKEVLPSASSFFSYKIYNSKYAVFTFNNFSYLKKFKVFLEGMFKDLKDNNIENLIIDIRNNEGGNSALGVELLSYMSKEPFYLYNQVLCKSSELSKKQYAEDSSIPEKTKEAFMQTKKGEIIYTDLSKDLLYPKDVSLQFKGKVYLLTSGKTFSSAADFASAFKYFKLGTIVGEQTGGMTVSAGEVIGVSLPNSQLDLNITTSEFINVGAVKGERSGVIPDIQVNPIDADQFAVKQITKSN